jgi:hypothetical protein
MFQFRARGACISALKLYNFISFKLRSITEQLPALVFLKMGWATFWAISSANSSGHPDEQKKNTEMNSS